MTSISPHPTTTSVLPRRGLGLPPRTPLIRQGPLLGSISLGRKPGKKRVDVLKKILTVRFFWAISHVPQVPEVGQWRFSGASPCPG